MPATPSAKETSSPFEELLVGLVRSGVDFALDIFTRMRGYALEAFRPRLRHLETSGVRVPYLAAEDLILLKQDSWREKDKLDVAALRKMLGR